MATHRVKAEKHARWFLLGLLLALLVTIIIAWGKQHLQRQMLYARMPEAGGWSQDTLRVPAGETLRLRLRAEDVVHGFAIGQSGEAGVVLYPGQPVDIDLRFTKPGIYTFYCTRWCGPNHWRMRGTIVVSGDQPPSAATPQPPLFVVQGIDIDAPHPAPVIPTEGTPSPKRGANLADRLPASYRTQTYYRTHSPAQTWQSLRTEPDLANLDDTAIWDLVAYIWQQAIPRQSLAQGAELYAQNCAACHGTQGRGDGPFGQPDTSGNLANFVPPPDFSDPVFALGASPALWQGKILRGGMGTGMPSWGTIFTTEESWMLTNYLWTFSILANE